MTMNNEVVNRESKPSKFISQDSDIHNSLEISSLSAVEHGSGLSLFLETQNKLSEKSQEKTEMQKRPTSAIRQLSPTQDKILQKLDDTASDVSYFRNIICFGSELKQSFPHRSDSETNHLLMHLKEATAAAEEVTTRYSQHDCTFATSLSEEDLEKARIIREKKIVEQETMLWKENPSKIRLKMDEVVEEKTHEHYTRGAQQAREGRFEAAVTSLSKALNLHSFDPSCFVERGEAFLQLCDFRSAFLNYKKAQQLRPSNPHIQEKLAFICYLEGQCLFDQALYADSLECFVRAADLKPNAKGYHLRAITCLAALSRNQECLALVTRRLDTESTANPELYVLRARLHQQFGNATLSYYDVRDALSLDPELLQAQKMMEEIRQKADFSKRRALEYTVQGKLSEALCKMTTAVQTDPSMPDYHVLRGALYRRMENFNSAIDDYLLCMDKADHDEGRVVYQAAQRQLLLTYNDFAVHCYHKGFYEEAVILLNKAIKGEKQEKGLYVNRGDCFFKLGELGFALADYQQALELDQSCWATKCRLSVVQNEFGISAYQERFYDEAAEYFERAIQLNNKVGQFYIHRARALYMMEEVEGARNDILTTLHLDPENDEMIPLLSRLFPGRSIGEVLQSKAAEQVRKQLASAMAPPLGSRRSSDSKRNCGSSNLSGTSSSTGKRTNEISSLCSASLEDVHLPRDKEILGDKKKITQELSEIFNFPLNLHPNQPLLLPNPFDDMRISRVGGWKRGNSSS